ncbi:kynureninase [Catenuloplanes nepalensis]|uniref:Kynureninase n=1 Tax=Catenuloplanes nepalensis TaxID=587533 RepID=A0ABT9MYL6_9ACTN|nr:kynureninase [Catenuloplanes nepalensis]MDP9796535.1 kynureninase [Catenuloplanes nepalensis]
MDESDALRRDAGDPGHRAAFLIPPAHGGRYPDSAYLVGNSLGLQPRSVRAELLAHMDDWATLGVEGWTEAHAPWESLPQRLAGPSARLVGARPEETVVMNTLTVNLHLLMISFYRPAGTRTRIVIEDAAFPSDSYAVRSQAVLHGLDPDTTVVRLRPRDGEDVLRTEDVIAAIDDRVALVLLAGVHYLTGTVADIPAITAAGHAAGAVVGWDLAHAAGNVELRLHDWDVDFAAWCNYKFLNSGPGSPGSAFVHARHLGDPSIARLDGWWGTEAATRFDMAPVSRPPATADAWQVSTPQILALAPMAGALALFDEAGMPVLRARSRRLTGYLLDAVDAIVPAGRVEVLTPRDPERRGAQLSLRLPGQDVGELAKRLRFGHGVLTDSRRPDVIRLAPVPLYSSYHDCWRAATALAAVL